METSLVTPVALAVVVKGYPRLSETFIAQEILNLEQSGFEITLFSLRLPTDKTTHPVHARINANVVYLPEYLYQQPRRIFKAWLTCRKYEGYQTALRSFLNDLRRDPSANRIRRFGQALVMSNELPPAIRQLYAHFLHTPASVTRYTAKILGLPWACSAHAKDIYTTPDWEIREKLAECSWLTTCANSNAEHLRARCHTPQKICLNYHGLDLARFDKPQRTPSTTDGSNPAQPVILLSVGRPVEKKGYHGLLQALATIDNTRHSKRRHSKRLHWKLLHIGGGALLGALQTKATQLGISQHIEWLGPQSQQTVLRYYRTADLFVLNCRIDQHGDRDGLPNVLLEAQSQGLAVVCTAVSAIPELIENQINGLLVAPEQPSQLAAALAKMITAPALRNQYGVNGQNKVREKFEMQAAFDKLIPRFKQF